MTIPAPILSRSPSVLEISGVKIEPGERRRLEIPVARLPTNTWLSLPVEVLQGTQAGVRLWISAAVHGDELNGVEIIRRVLAQVQPDQLKGTLIAVPIVNVFGFIEQSRYLPDRRDLNRHFPGSPRGSLAARLAHLFMTEIVSRCTHGVDIHTGSYHRANLPHVRADLRNEETRRCAAAFGAPVIVDARVRDGSLREAATERGIHVLLYEAGEASRFNDDAIIVGVRGILRLMRTLRMRTRQPAQRSGDVLAAGDTTWVRARRGGIVRMEVDLGDRVRHKQLLATVSGALGEDTSELHAPNDGLVIGVTRNPLVNRGDGVVNLTKGPLEPVHG